MKKIIVISMCLLLNQASFAASHDAAKQLKTELENIKTFSAGFDQRIVDAGHKPVSKSNGALFIKRPGKFYWEGRKPDPILVVADGKTLWTYDIELEQVTKQPITEALDNTPASLLAGDVDHLERDFKVSFATEKKCVTEADTCFHLESKNEDKAFSDIYISMNQGLFIALMVHDQLGQEILTRFSGIKMNAPVDESKFKFTPPKGVDVIEHQKG
jgi:outer membrane lipoprotein carrier protein